MRKTTIVTENAILNLGIKKQELDTLVKKYQSENSIVFSNSEGITQFNIEAIIELLKKPEVQLEFGLSTPIQLYQTISEMGLVKSNDDKAKYQVSDKLSYAANNELKDSHVVLTVNHTSKERKVFRRLYRTTLALTFLVNSYSENKKNNPSQNQDKKSILDMSYVIQELKEQKILIKQLLADNKQLFNVNEQYQTDISKLQEKVFSKNDEKIQKVNSDFVKLNKSDLLKLEIILKNNSCLVTKTSEGQKRVIQKLNEQFSRNSNDVVILAKNYGIINDLYSLV